ncbi:acyl-CoA desaturase [uncultured Sunxiuqinia sp.]|uniref:fatty acid desaturase family protein n=1 Tax=uncultured Sunxiuqinia sp. TaxID=1573825 RepID=UPI00261683D4|nr:acyl-CoA desaturase [uncultured Sunxiuqinia sp.]
MKTPAIQFPNTSQQEFVLELRKRIFDYFEENNISKYGNSTMFLKTAFMFSLYLVPYFLMIFSVVTNPLILFFLWVTMGFGMAGIGLSVMHDANHNSYSKNQTVNKVLSYSLNLLGGFSPTWKYQHNTLHHHYTNIEGHDEDIDAGKALRLSPNKPRYKFHRFQHFYAWFLYSLMTLMWTTSKDFKQLYRYSKEGVLLGRKSTYRKLLMELIVSKVFYYSYILLIPILVLPVAWWMVLLFYLSMHLICGFILTVIFQTAHVMPGAQYPVPDDSGTVENNWAIHQLLTTTDYAPGNRLFSWFVGGLNFQVEHHLFPAICHVHYQKIASLVKETARKYNLPYRVQSSFFQAIGSHFKMLRMLGR